LRGNLHLLTLLGLLCTSCPSVPLRLSQCPPVLDFLITESCVALKDEGALADALWILTRVFAHEVTGCELSLCALLVRLIAGPSFPINGCRLTGLVDAWCQEGAVQITRGIRALVTSFVASLRRAGDARTCLNLIAFAKALFSGPGQAIAADHESGPAELLPPFITLLRPLILSPTLDVAAGRRTSQGCGTGSGASCDGG
jgi:hypothetical protein